MFRSGHPQLAKRVDVLRCHPVLTERPGPSNIHVMAHSFLIFEFGGNEETAQQARHKIEAWKQGYRLDKKLQVKFDRGEEATTEAADAAAEHESEHAEEPKKGGGTKE